ncbi:hypothetical protein WA026_019760 [Henosepilachna vigintioctopunctata]|uniref:Uncharacterized protein n=1 Tax=Henosepilachna vigintioctopunctata TaxID=420089 RepID=A0AAW1UGS5_9CUCU
MKFPDNVVASRKNSRIDDECEVSSPQWACMGTIAHSFSPKRGGQWPVVGHIQRGIEGEDID